MRGMFLIAAAVVAGPAVAAPAAKDVGPGVGVSAERSSYSAGLGTKSLVMVEARLPLGGNEVLTVKAGRGERREPGGLLRADGVSLTLAHRIAPGLTSRIELARGGAGPLFARGLVGEELAYRFGNTEVRGGGRLSRYADGTLVRSFRAGVDQKFGPVSLGYGLVAYHAAGSMPAGLIYRFGAGLKDRYGSTAVQLATGSSLHEHDWRPEKVEGSFRSIDVKRKHKLLPGVAVEFGSGWTAFERPKGSYRAVKWSAGLAFSR